MFSRSRFGFVTGAVLGLFGCGGLFGKEEPQVMTPASDTVAGAKGTVTTSLGENENTNLKVRVEHLAPPSRVSREATVYVVWVRPSKDEPYQNVGALKVDEDLVGSLETVTPLRDFMLYVTPEADARATKPTNAPVFTTEVRATR